VKNNKEDYQTNLEYKEFTKECGERFRELNKWADLHGVFLDDREMLSCPQCGLKEDTTFSGKLFTYKKGDPEFKETGLQFIALDDQDERFKCPTCHIEILVSPEKE
jgi:predicted RNA-binding Zn-ribbon protein involved in translation (DUF1610 family)